jgi:glycosidase
MSMPQLSTFIPLALALTVASACGEDELGGAGGGPPGTTNVAGGLGEECSDVGDPCDVTFWYPIGSETSVELRGDFADGAWDVGVPMYIDAGSWRVTLPIANGRTVRYKFFVDGATYVQDPNNPDEEDDGFGGKRSVKYVTCGGGPCSEPSGGGDGDGDGDGGAGPSGSGGVTSGGGAGLPEGAFDWRSAVMYFAFVDRFRNGDPSNDAPVDDIEEPANFQGGDYRGVLDAIEEGYFESLGVNAIWLTVPMNNPSVAGLGADGRNYSAYHGYWPTHLDQVEEHFGTMDDLKAIVAAAHERDIKILLDYAMNHVHTDAQVFRDHPDWFWPLQDGERYCVCGDGCAWDGDDGRRCWFRDYLPDWNFTNATARTASIDNALWWIKETGIDGYRLDAVKHIETQWLIDLRARLRDEIEPVTGEHFYTVGETFDTGNRDLLKSYIGPNMMDGQFDFPLRGVAAETLLRRSGSMFDLDGFLASNDDFYGPGSIMSTWLGNHDIARIVHVADDSPWGAWDNGGTQNWEDPPDQPTNGSNYQRLAIGFTFLMTTKGVPLVYYGDEIGLAGAGDPDNRRFMPWDGADISDAQEGLRSHIGKLGQIRRENPALWRGTRSTVSVTNDTYGYKMTDGPSTVYVAINRGDLDGTVDGLPAAMTDLLTGNAVTGPLLTLPPRSSMILVEN